MEKQTGPNKLESDQKGKATDPCFLETRLNGEADRLVSELNGKAADPC